MFSLHPRLVADTHSIVEDEHLLTLLLDDARFPWIVVVPKVQGAEELSDLSHGERDRLQEHAVRCGAALREADTAKLNIATIGNIVRQLHCHVVARREGDAAWPGPVWGAGERVPYADDAARDVVERMRKMIA